RGLIGVRITDSHLEHPDQHQLIELPQGIGSLEVSAQNAVARVVSPSVGSPFIPLEGGGFFSLVMNQIGYTAGTFDLISEGAITSIVPSESGDLSSLFHAYFTNPDPIFHPQASGRVQLVPTAKEGQFEVQFDLPIDIKTMFGTFDQRFVG